MNSLIEQHIENFNGKPIPTLLMEMLKNEDWHNESDISDGFCLEDEYSEDLFNSYFENSNQTWENKLISLGQADATGASYAFFIVDEQKPVEENPIIALSSEGSVLLAAANFKDFLRLLSIGIEPSYGETLFFHIHDDIEIPTHQKTFHQWLKSKNIQPLTPHNYEDESEKIINNANHLYKNNMLELFK